MGLIGVILVFIRRPRSYCITKVVGTILKKRGVGEDYQYLLLLL